VSDLEEYIVALRYSDVRINDFEDELVWSRNRVRGVRIRFLVRREV
jgi:hypothetical protein